ncbi:hypothetical protein FBY05_10845 [Pseudomonas sp. SJZ083]|nr:hypothetical protein FBY05_10845 [Pseudomonas sp. SJZ083]TWC48104.1 hypothetical protein FBY01_108204 [Pseudomonas sp. SJZ077]
MITRFSSIHHQQTLPNLTLNNHPIPIKPLIPQHLTPLPFTPHLPPNLIPPKHPPTLAQKPMPNLINVIPPPPPHPITQQFPFQLLLAHVQLQLKMPIRRVMQYQINVVIKNRRP